MQLTYALNFGIKIEAAEANGNFVSPDLSMRA